MSSLKSLCEMPDKACSRSRASELEVSVRTKQTGPVFIVFKNLDTLRSTCSLNLGYNWLGLYGRGNHDTNLHGILYHVKHNDYRLCL